MTNPLLRKDLPFGRQMRRLPAAAICSLYTKWKWLWSNEDIADVWLGAWPKGLDFRPQKSGTWLPHCWPSLCHLKHIAVSRKLQLSVCHWESPVPIRHLKINFTQVPFNFNATTGHTATCTLNTPINRRLSSVGRLTFVTTPDRPLGVLMSRKGFPPIHTHIYT